MDTRLAVLTAFPPAAAGIDDEEYYRESQNHINRVEDLIREHAQWIIDSADDILQVHSTITSPNQMCPWYRVVVQTD